MRGFASRIGTVSGAVIGVRFPVCGHRCAVIGVRSPLEPLHRRPGAAGTDIG